MKGIRVRIMRGLRTGIGSRELFKRNGESMQYVYGDQDGLQGEGKGVLK